MASKGKKRVGKIPFSSLEKFTVMITMKKIPSNLVTSRMEINLTSEKPVEKRQIRIFIRKRTVNDFGIIRSPFSDRYKKTVKRIHERNRGMRISSGSAEKIRSTTQTERNNNFNTVAFFITVFIV